MSCDIVLTSDQGNDSMASRKRKGTTVYPDQSLRFRVQEIADADPNGATFSYYACYLMRLGLSRYEKRQQRRRESERMSKLQPN